MKSISAIIQLVIYKQCLGHGSRRKRESRPRENLHYLNIVVISLIAFTFISRAIAQQDQDNWYLRQTLPATGTTATNGGLSSPYGVAISPNGTIYAGDQGYGCIQAYQPNGTYSFSITNGFGGGQAFSQPRGMICDNQANLYIADFGSNCVYEFSATGLYIRTFGPSTGTTNGPLNGVMDVAVSTAGLVYVIENLNNRISVFNPDGSFNRILVGPGFLASQLDNPVGVTISDGGTIAVAQNYTTYQGDNFVPNHPFFPGSTFLYTKFFDTNGNFLTQIQDIGYALYGEGGAGDGCGNTIWTYLASSSIRFDHSGLLHSVLGLFSSWYQCNGPWGTLAPSTQWHIFNHDGSPNQKIAMPITTAILQEGTLWPCIAVGPDGTMIFASRDTATLEIFGYAKRELDPLPYNAPSMPEILQVSQRPTNSAILDVCYQVTDMDDTNTTAGMLVFTNGIQSLSSCVQAFTFMEGTATNVDTIVPTGQPMHVAWNAGADWPTTNLQTCRVAIMARDNRQGLLDVHYVNLPADHGLPALQISASPLVQSDFSQAWWWLLATNDPGISLPPQQKLWVNGVGSGSLPRLWYKAVSIAL